MASPQNNDHNKSIRFRILLPALLALLGTMVSAIVGIYLMQSNHFDEDLRKQIKQTHLLFEQQKLDETNLLNGLIDGIKRDTVLQGLWLSKDRDRLLRQATRQFNHMRNKYRVTHFYFIELDKKCFLRVHNPPRRGDIIKRSTLKQAVFSGGIGSGIELGPLGTFTLRVVHPWYINGKRTGYIELGMEINHLLPAIKKNLGVDIFLIIKKALLKRKDWEAGMKMLGRTADWDRLNDHVLIDSSIRKFPNIEEDAYKQHLQAHEKGFYDPAPHEISAQDVRYGIAFAPLIDAAGQDVGDMFILSNITQEQMELARLMIILVVITVIIATLLLVPFYFYLGHIEDRIKQSRYRLVKETRARERALIKAKEAAEETTKMKTRLIANLSRELRTPLNRVLGTLQVLRDTPLSEEQDNCINSATESGKLLITLINNILDFSKIDARQMLPEHINFNLHVTLKDIVASFKKSANDKGLKLNCRINANVPQWINGDPTRMRQILNNLISNAIKFSDDGEIIISLKLEEDILHNPMLLIEVTDTGIGIPVEDQEKIFDSFVQADGSTNRSYGGTGLGLAIVRQAVESMGGYLNMHSTPAEGSTFAIHMPITIAKAKTHTATPLSDLHGMHVLVVNPVGTQESILPSQYLRIEEVNNGDAAIKKLHEQCGLGDPYIITIVEQNKAINVLDLARQIKNDEAIANTHLLLLTSREKQGDEELSRYAGYNGYLIRPVSDKDLHHCISEMLALGYEPNKILVTRRYLAEHDTEPDI